MVKRFWLGLFLCVLATLAQAEENISRSLVKIYTTANIYNYKTPWQAPIQQNQIGTGFIISGNRILTNAHVVANSVFIEVRLANDAMRYTAFVETIGHDCDLAVLRVENPKFFDDSLALKFGHLSKSRERVTVFGFPLGGEELSITEGIVSRVETQEYVHSGARLLIQQIDAGINLGNSGGPVLSQNKVVGVVHQSFWGGQNIGYMIPLPVVEHFLKDSVHQSGYAGFPTLDLTIQSMENADLRNYYHMGSQHTGIRIAQINPFSSVAGILQINDIILAVDGIPIFNDGTVLFEQQRLSADYLISRHFIGESISFKILRNKQVETLSVPLKNRVGSERLVPFTEYDKVPTYYVFGGLVFQPLTLNYLQGWGNDWQNAAPTNLVYEFIYGQPSKERHELVFLNRVLADELNAGYQGLQNAIVKEVNGQKIRSMKDVIQAFSLSPSAYHSILLEGDLKIILEKERVLKGHEKLLKKYSIASPSSPDLVQEIFSPAAA